MLCISNVTFLGRLTAGARAVDYEFERILECLQHYNHRSMRLTGLIEIRPNYTRGVTKNSVIPLPRAIKT